MRRLFLFFASLILLSACATSPPLTENEIDPGPYPSNYEDIIRQHLKQTLFDPDSLRDLSVPAPTKLLVKSNYRDFGIREGQYVYECKYVWYNAKNQMGGYTGKKPHIFWIRNGTVVMGW